MKEYMIFRYHTNGNVVYCATFGTIKKAQEVVAKWKANNPFAMYQIHER